jgi:branched-chain amino acid transport system permease protein
VRNLPTLARHAMLAVVIALALYALTNVVGAYRDLQLAQAAYFACAAAGLTVLTGLSGQISLGQGAFMAIGAYTTALLIGHWPLVLALLAAVVVSAVAGLLVGAAAARLRGPYLAGATLALAVGLPELANYGPLTKTLGAQNGLSVAPSPPPLALGEEFPLERWQAWITCAAAVITMFLLANLTRSRFGRTFRAVRDDEIAASLAGIHVARTQVLAFVVAAACGGLGGGLLAFVTSLAAPGAFTIALSLQLISAIILGGLGSLAGAIWGSLILVLVPSWASDFSQSAHLSHNVEANLPLAIYGLVLVLVMLVFPAGVQGGLRTLFRPLAHARRTE